MAQGTVPSPVKELTITLADGRVVSGSYYSDRGIVTVMTAHGRKSAQIGSSFPDSVARIMLWELADEKLDSSPEFHGTMPSASR
jgi:hypothetical protein